MDLSIDKSADDATVESLSYEMLYKPLVGSESQDSVIQQNNLDSFWCLVRALGLMITTFTAGSHCN